MRSSEKPPRYSDTQPDIVSGYSKLRSDLANIRTAVRLNVRITKEEENLAIYPDICDSRKRYSRKRKSRCLVSGRY